ncbi:MULTISPECIES: gliding motility lipoprotein GldD [unclassified Myroides]|uniref:gliding motility lipoprotein GldD n=1 Tax=unclassified Myroides TaxID=2642485 RepID=UPI003D2F6AD2
MFHKTLSLYGIAFLGLFLTLGSCKKESTPRPNAYLALNYPEPSYQKYENSYHHFTFDLNKNASVKELKPTAFEVHYPQMKATIFMNYKTVDNNLDALLKDAQKLTYEHFIKADEIVEQPFINAEDRVYGMFYHVGGDAATNVQFYATDSVKNFVVASLYFYAKPNFDSILPASHYIQQDMRQMLESLQWEHQ